MTYNSLSNSKEKDFFGVMESFQKMPKILKVILFAIGIIGFLGTLTMEIRCLINNTPVFPTLKFNSFLDNFTLGIFVTLLPVIYLGFGFLATNFRKIWIAKLFCFSTIIFMVSLYYLIIYKSFAG